MTSNAYRGFGLLGPGPGLDAADEDPIERLKKQIGFNDEPVQDTRGYWTIGYGRRLSDTRGGPKPQATISEPIADEELRYFVDQGGDPSARIAPLKSQICEGCASSPSDSVQDGLYPNAEDGSVEIAAADQPPAANDNNRSNEAVCDQAYAACNANARNYARSPESFIGMRKQCATDRELCFDVANSPNRNPQQPQRVYFTNTGFVVFRPGQPAVFEPYDGDFGG